MTKLLFLGCNFDQLPYLKIARQKGYNVIGTDLNKNAPGARYLDKYYQIGYEDANGLINLGEKEQFLSTDKIFTASSQFAYIGAGIFSEMFGMRFVSQKTADICLNKIKLYKLFKKHKMEVPQWMIVKNQNVIKPILKKWNAAYLKSDYGKSPHYCYKIKDGNIPRLPLKFDRYFRKYFIAQQAIAGNHFRINWIRGGLICFFKISDTAAIPAYFIDFNKKIKKNISRLIFELGLRNHLVKFDVIYANGRCYFIDIGLDPPMRLKLYLEYLGYDFEKIYFEWIVENKNNFPSFANLPKNLIVKNKIVKKL